MGGGLELWQVSEDRTGQDQLLGGKEKVLRNVQDGLSAMGRGYTGAEVRRFAFTAQIRLLDAAPVIVSTPQFAKRECLQ